MHKFKVVQIPSSTAVKRNFHHSKLKLYTVIGYLSPDRSTSAPTISSTPSGNVRKRGGEEGGIRQPITEQRGGDRMTITALAALSRCRHGDHHLHPNHRHLHDALVIVIYSPRNNPH